MTKDYTTLSGRQMTKDYCTLSGRQMTKNYSQASKLLHSVRQANDK